MREHHLEVSRTARYCSLGEAGADTREVWLVCHGYAQLASSFLKPFEAVASGARLVLAPEALNRFYLEERGGPHGAEHPVGATWMTRHDREAEIRDYVAYLDTLYAHVFAKLRRDDVRVTALGFSQGVATVSRWAAFGAARLDRLVLWGSRLPPDLDLALLAERLRRAETVLVAGVEDAYFNGEAAEREAARLAEEDIAARVVTFEGGHRLGRGVLQRLAGE